MANTKVKNQAKKKVKERRKKGTVKAYVSRAVAIKKLQVSLADFRRLCILKGVYPVEPKNKSKLTGANTTRKTYFFTRDIQTLMQEPILYKFWEFKVFMKRLTRAKGRHDLEKFQQVMDNKPFYKLDTVVKERYPRFVDALRDCDDALNMCFLFAMFPKGPGRPDDLIDLSRKLTVEFTHYIINSKSLRKVFISIKGYYYQAEIMGQTVTWLVPHQFVIENILSVDLNVMKTFTEFYVTLLGFINYRLYKTINAVYPPQVVAETIKDLISDTTAKKRKRKSSSSRTQNEDMRISDSDELIAALNKRIRVVENKSVTNVESDDQKPDVFDDLNEKNKDEENGMALQQILALERLFDGLKFFLNREVPRESLTFIIRSFSGEVSWDKYLFPGATFDESNPTITHHIIDRESLVERRLDRVYVQPQWVYDSINARMMLPTADYLIGATLPPHLSPFVASSQQESKRPADKKHVERTKSTSRSKTTVKAGKICVDDEEEEDEAETRRLGIMMIPKKKKRLFDKIMKTQKQKGKKVAKLQAKKRIVEDAKSRRDRAKNSR